MVLRYLIEKEFKQLRRHSFIPKLIIVMPIMVMLIFPWVANQEVKNIKLSVIDQDKSTYSQQLIQKVIASGYFRLTDVSESNTEALNSIESGKADIILEIPKDFEKSLVREKSTDIMISANSINGMKGGLGSFYLSSIIQDFAGEIRSELSIRKRNSIPKIDVIPTYRFNPHMDYKVFMIPALMVMLITLFSGFLPALNIVSEKETGTIEQMNVTPVRKTTFVIGKLIPYWFIGFAVLTICLLLAFLIYGLYPKGNILTIYLFASVYILVVSGVGLVISNYSYTMQQAMFVMFFFLMLFILMSGLFTPINSMPDWAQTISAFNPLTYFMQVMRAVYLKGSALGDLIRQFLILCTFAVVLNSWAVLSYRKKS